MSSGLYDAEELYRLLPAVHRVRDAEQGGVLRELMEVITEQVNAVAESIEQLYDDQFVETCAPWVAPYIGDLIGYRTLHGVVPHVASPRAEVANTVRYRRRKGTASMLEQLARDVTGWPARTVEMFELLAATQYMNHIRLHAAAVADLRHPLRLESVGGAFDDLAHTVDVRRVTGGSGRHNIPNIAIFLWRVQARPLTRSPLVDIDGAGRRYRFDPLGTDAPLFTLPRTEVEITHLAEPLDVPAAISRRTMAAGLAALYGPGLSLNVEVDGAGVAVPVPLADVAVCDLSDDPASPGTWNHEPAAGEARVAIDPVLGRIAFGDPAPGSVRRATFHHGSALAIGGGGYDRPTGVDPVEPVHTVSGGGDLAAHLVAAATGGTVILGDCDRYSAPATASVGGRLVVEAANRQRPLVAASGSLTLDMDADATVVLDGLTVVGGPLLLDAAADAGRRTIILRHCTLVPGWARNPDGSAAGLDRASVVVLHPFTTVVLDHCITGPIVAADGVELRANDSVIDAGDAAHVAVCGREGAALDLTVGDGLTPAGPVALDACTVVGKVHGERLDVSNSILLARLADAGDAWPAPVWAERRQVGCMRFSFVPIASRVPRRFHCVPVEGEADTDVLPQLTSLRFGDPGYVQLRHATPAAVRRGADDESEMGVTHGLHQPQRETNLQLRLDEYLRFGLEAGFFYVS